MGRERYRGVQTFLTDGCYFFSLCSVAEDFTGSKVDIIDVANYAIAKGYATADAYINDPIAILAHLTGHQWKLEVLPKVPAVVEDNQYTILKYKWKGTHFRRRDIDTIIDSQTVKYGNLKECYLFTVTL